MRKEDGTGGDDIAVSEHTDAHWRKDVRSRLRTSQKQGFVFGRNRQRSSSVESFEDDTLRQW